MSLISNILVPLIILIIVCHGRIKKIDVYDSFIRGAIDGMKTSYTIAPYIMGIFLAIGIFKVGYGIKILEYIFYPILKLFSVPKELLSLIIIKPLSGSGSLAIYKDIISRVGIDSLTEKMGATIIGSSETIFYTMAIYYGSLKIKNIRHTLPCALMCHIAGVLASVFICYAMFK